MAAGLSIRCQAPSRPEQRCRCWLNRWTGGEKLLSPIEKGLAAPELLAHVLVSNYGDHLPLHRLPGPRSAQG